ncbi:hypothetical protein [Flavobacterium sp. NRK1]|uniref:hypothetical protein n=1 Tax=Flavobacterium sp. NRK1 TaxID=2954929 RepID=UPI002092E1CD|nr:hypothetical protein [Flavobacterium sp. NRK1]MCO6147483.1 hypothetical protein [Flavobacterium sp. NRK1]
MKKILPYLFVAALTFSCSNDDDKTTTTPSDPDDINLLPCANSITLILNTQEEVNNFAALGYCSVGDLKIGSPDWPSDITDLTPLSSILNVQREISISYNVQLTNLYGLHNIINAGGNLSIVNNPALVSLDALSNLKTTKGNIFVSGNAALTDATGLKNVVPDDDVNITITDNPLLNAMSFEGVTAAYNIVIGNTGLKNLTGFSDLKTAYSINIANSNALEALELNSLTNLDELIIKACPVLQSISGLEDIAELDRLEISETVSLNALTPLHNTSIHNIRLFSNEGLTSLDGLNSVTEVNYLLLTNNPGLTSLTALGNLKVVKDISPAYATLFISDNNALQTLEGLQGITEFNGVLNVSGNPALSDFCAIQYIIDHGVYNYPSSFISGNLYQPDFTVEGGCSMD